MSDIRYRYEHVPTIKAFSESKAFIRGLMGPFGSGKSSGCVIELVKWAMRQPKGPDGIRHSRFAVIRNTYPQLKDTTIRTVQQWLPWPSFGDFSDQPPNYRVNRLMAGVDMEILFRALDRPEQVANLLSLELTGAWVNEAREVPEAIIKALKGRVGRFPAMSNGGCVDPGIILDSNPPDDDSWWHRMFEEERPTNVQVFKQPSGRSEGAENLPNLRPGYYEMLLEGEDEDFIRVYVDGEYGYVKDGKPVYPEYRDSVHCKDVDPVPGLEIYRGWDFGLMPAVVFSQVTPDGRWNTFDELTADTIGVDAFADGVLLHSGRKYPDYEFIDIGDPAGMQTSALVKPTDARDHFAVLRGKGIDIGAGEQTLAMRLGSVKLALNTMIAGHPQVIVHSRCTKLRKGYQGRYQYRRIKIAGAEERFHDMPDKNEYSHPHDANQYVATRLFGAKLKNKKVGKVMAYKEPEMVVGGWMG